MQPGPVEPPALRQGLPRGRRHFVQRVGQGEPLLGGESLDLPAELCAKLVVVAGDQGTPVEREVTGCERMNGPADDVGDDEVTGVDHPAVAIPGDALGARGQREQRRIGGEVRGGAGRRFGKPACHPDGQPGAGQPEAENLIGVHWDAVLQGAHWVKPPNRTRRELGNSAEAEPGGRRQIVAPWRRTRRR